jgi:maltose alpha-D-glucosyltransferase/alpha-amylase
MRSLELLRSQLNRLPEDARDEAKRVLDLEPRIAQALRAFLARRLTTTRIRVHGDYHLGQVLYTGHDFVIIDFEGEPTRSLYERRLKRLALRDVAGMLRSFDYASQAAVRSGHFEPESRARLEAWARFWVDSVSAAFLRSYLTTAGTASFVPQNAEDLDLQLSTMLLEKALYELRYELNSRPDWVRIPLRGILEVVHPA